MFDQIDGAVATLEAVARDLEPDCLSGEAAAWLVDRAGKVERLGAAMKTLAARRVEETKEWKRDGHRDAAEWLARQTGESRATASRTLETARNLEGLGATEEAFRAGELSERQASEIASAAHVDPNAEDDLLDAAANESMHGLRNKAREVRAGAEDDQAWARRLHLNRRLERWTDAEGAYRINGRFVPDAGARFDSALEGHIDVLWKEACAAGRHEPREAYAADALIKLATEGPCKPPEVKLLAHGAAVQRGYTKAGERCEIQGIGAVPVTIARKLLDDAQISLLVEDGDDISSVGRARRTISAALRRQLETRYPVCGVPGCANAFMLQIDHVIAFALGGPTTIDNLWRICSHHHDLKTYFGWKVSGSDRHWDLIPPDDPRASKDPRAPDDPDPPP